MITHMQSCTFALSYFIKVTKLQNPNSLDIFSKPKIQSCTNFPYLSTKDIDKAEAETELQIIMTKNITTPWTFQDGREYILSLNVVEHPTVNAALKMTVTDKITNEEWSCGFDAKYIENLTQKTGSFKPFPVFISMLQSALLKKSDSVALDLMNLADLEKLREQKGHTTTAFFGGKCSHFNFKHNNGELNSSLGGDNAGNGIRDKCQNNDSTSSKKKFLIIQYSAEFDKVHYPIPLNYSGPPNLGVMQKNILQLKSEVVALRNAKSSLEEEVGFLKQTQSSGFNPEGMQNSNYFCSNDLGMNQLRQNMNTKFARMDYLGCESGSGKMKDSRCPENETLVEKLAQKLNTLEEKFNAERADHCNKIESLQAENEFLRQKLTTSEKYQGRLEEEIFHLTNNGALLISRARTSEIYNGATIKGNEMKKKSISKPLTIGNSDDRGTGDNGFARTGRGKTSLAYLGRRSGSPGISPLPRRSRSFSPSPNRVSFDPTAYIREKKLKQELMAQLRLDKIKAQLSRVRHSSSSSAEGKDNRALRTRSNSRESRNSSPQVNGLLRGRPPGSRTTTNRHSSQSPHPRTSATTATQTKTHRNFDALCKEIDDKLAHSTLRHKIKSQLQNEPELSLQKKKTPKSRIPNPVSLHAHVDKLVRQEFPILGKLDRSSKKNNINIGVIDLNHDDIIADHHRLNKPSTAVSKFI